MSKKMKIIITTLIIIFVASIGSANDSDGPMCSVSDDLPSAAIVELTISSRDRGNSIRDVLWPRPVKWHKIEIGERSWTWGERQNANPLLPTKKNQIGTLAGIAAIDFLQTITFLYRLPGVRKTTYQTQSSPDAEGASDLRVLVDCNPTCSYSYIEVIHYNHYSVPVTVYTPYTEGNPILGKRPQRWKVATFGAIGTALVAAAAYFLPEPWAQIVVDSAVTSEALLVEDNNRIFSRGEDGVIPIPIVLTWRF